MDTTEIEAPRRCVDCIFFEGFEFHKACQFYPKYKKVEFPRHRTGFVKPAFCQITKIVVYEKSLEETWGGPDIRD